MRKRIFFTVLVLALVGGGIYYYVINKSHRDIKNTTEDFLISSTDLYKEYSTDETASNAKYLDKIIAVEGTVAELQLENPEEPTVAVSTGVEGMTVSCGFVKDSKAKVETLKPGQKIKIKGKCDGMGMFGVVLTQCHFIEE